MAFFITQVYTVPARANISRKTIVASVYFIPLTHDLKIVSAQHILSEISLRNQSSSPQRKLYQPPAINYDIAYNPTHHKKRGLKVHVLAHIFSPNTVLLW